MILNQALPHGGLDSSLLITLGGLCLLVLAVVLLRRAQQRTPTFREVTREQRAWLREQQELKGQLEELLGEIEEVSRRVDAQTASRLTRLENLIGAADKRIAQLGAGTQSGRRSTGPGAAADSLRVADTPRRSGEPATTHAQSPVRAPGPISEPVSVAESSVPRLPDPRREVYAMADTGATAATIADALQQPVGEVELILALRRYGGSDPAEPGKSSVSASNRR